MASVTYKNQPGINKTKGNVPLKGTRHLYTVNKVLWPDEVSEVLMDLIDGMECLHVCAGKSPIGDYRLDMDAANNPDVIADAAQLPFEDESIPVVLCDPPYNGKFQWNHDMLKELARVAAYRIIFQHWFLPVNPDGKYKKWTDRWELQDAYIWQPRTYFGRVQVISVFGRCDE